jgi:hypothetical protein
MSVKVSKSKIEGAGKGLFTSKPFKKGELIGLAHKDGQPVGDIGKMHNHSEEPTAFSVKLGNKRFIYANGDLKPGEEITTDYRMQPELEQPDDFKKGGSIPKMPKKKNAKAYSRSIEATNRLFTKNPLFEQPKSRKNKIYDPKAKYYQDGGSKLGPISLNSGRFASKKYPFGKFSGVFTKQEGGEPEYNNLPPTYLATLRNFVYPNVVADPRRTGHNALTNTISYDPESPIENVNNDWWMEHELFHELQNQAGGLSTSGIVGERPNQYVASDQAIQSYYDRRDADVNRVVDQMIAENPELQFVPRERLIKGSPAFVGAESLQYSDPSTLEGEARQYEQYIEAGNPSIFPQGPDNYVELELTPEEIEEYKKGGYIIEDISVPTLSKFQDGGDTPLFDVFTWKDDPSSYYRKNENGEWEYLNSRTRNEEGRYKFTKVEDPKAIKKLNRQAEYNPNAAEQLDKWMTEEVQPYIAPEITVKGKKMSWQERRDLAKQRGIVESPSMQYNIFNDPQYMSSGQLENVANTIPVVSLEHQKWKDMSAAQKRNEGIHRHNAYVKDITTGRMHADEEQSWQYKEPEALPYAYAGEDESDNTSALMTRDEANKIDKNINDSQFFNYIRLNQPVIEQVLGRELTDADLYNEDGEYNYAGLSELYNNQKFLGAVEDQKYKNFLAENQKAADEAGVAYNTMDFLRNLAVDFPSTVGNLLTEGKMPLYQQAIGLRSEDPELQEFYQQYMPAGLEDVNSMVNLLNPVAALQDAQINYDRGNYGSAALYGLGALPLVGALGKGVVKGLRMVDDVARAQEEMVDLWRIQEKGARPMSELAAEGKLGPIFQNEKAIQHFKDREKYFGQWFTKDKADFDFYRADREFQNPEIIQLQVPKSKLADFQNYDKSLSRAADREFVIPLEQQKLFTPKQLPGSSNVTPVINATPTPWTMQEMPGLHLKSTMSDGAVSKIVEPKTGLVNVEQALGIIGKESGGADKVALIKQGLGETLPKKMDYNEFRKVVQDQLIPLERQFSTRSSAYGINKLGYGKYKTVYNERGNPILQPRKGKNLEPLENQTLILSNKGNFGRGSNAHGNPDETLGHIHFLIDAKTPDVLTITQIQSDAFQGPYRIMPKTQQEALEKVNKLKEEGKEIKSLFSDGKESSNSVLANYEKHLQLDEASSKNFTQKQLLDKNHQERYLQEIVNYAGERGDINKLRLPTSETAAKVQGYEPVSELNKSEEFIKLRTDMVNTLEKYGTNSDQYKKASDLYEQAVKNSKHSYSSEHQTILKKYAEQPKIIKKLFGVEPKVVKDSKGNTWYEFNIPEEFKGMKGEIKAFSMGGMITPPAVTIGARTLQQEQDGGFIEIELSSKEIEEYKSKGYIVEEY